MKFFTFILEMQLLTVPRVSERRTRRAGKPARRIEIRPRPAFAAGGTSSAPLIDALPAAL